jgi:hypothetical protein
LTIGPARLAFAAAPASFRFPLAGGRMAVRFRLPGGTLKLKRYAELRSAERRRELPMLRIGRLFLVWWPGGRQ